MSVRHAVTAGCLVFICCLPALCKDAVAIAALQSALQALSGGQAPAVSMSLSGTAEYSAGSDQETFPITLIASDFDDTTITFQRAAGQVIEVRRRGSGTWTGSDQVTHQEALHNTWTSAAWFSPALLIGSWINDNELVISDLGHETRNGVAVEHIQAIRQPSGAGTGTLQVIANESRMDLYVDSVSFLPVALEFNGHPDNDAGSKIPIRIEYGGYTTTGSVGAQPFRIEEFIQNTPLLNITVTNAAVSAGITGQ